MKVIYKFSREEVVARAVVFRFHNHDQEAGHS